MWHERLASLCTISCKFTSAGKKVKPTCFNVKLLLILYHKRVNNKSGNRGRVQRVLGDRLYKHGILDLVKDLLEWKLLHISVFQSERIWGFPFLLKTEITKNGKLNGIVVSNRVSYEASSQLIAPLLSTNFGIIIRSGLDHTAEYYKKLQFTASIELIFLDHHYEAS